jgi:hypothetical protein
VYAPVAGESQNVLAQCFERRCLTFTPANPEGREVEEGNIGQHYCIWRYGDRISDSPEPFLPPGVSGSSPVGPSGCVSINEAGIDELVTIIHINHDIA